MDENNGKNEDLAAGSELSDRLGAGLKTARRGSLLQVDIGCYSDYGVIGFFVVLRDFEPITELKAYLAANPKDETSYSFESDSFLMTLISKGLLLEVEHGTLYMGEYADSSTVRFHPVGDA